MCSKLGYLTSIKSWACDKDQARTGIQFPWLGEIIWPNSPKHEFWEKTSFQIWTQNDRGGTADILPPQGKSLSEIKPIQQETNQGMEKEKLSPKVIIWGSDHTVLEVYTTVFSYMNELQVFLHWQWAYVLINPSWVENAPNTPNLQNIID